MPSPKHPCASASCGTLITKGAIYCRRHRVKTPEHIAKIAEALRGRTFTPEQRHRMSLSKRGAGAMNRVCAACGSPFTVTRPSRSQQFCSRRCGCDQRRGERAKNWRHDMPIKDCLVCGHPFRLPASTVAAQRFTCSYTCKNVWLKTHQPNKATNIERIVARALDAHGWSYVPQAALCNVAVADFYLPDVRVAIFCDGDYWHSLPGKAERDAKQTAILEGAGYSVHRFRGIDIIANVDECLAAIRHS